MHNQGLFHLQEKQGNRTLTCMTFLIQSEKHINNIIKIKIIDK